MRTFKAILGVSLFLGACSNGAETNNRSADADKSTQQESDDSIGVKGTEASFNLSLPKEFEVEEGEVEQIMPLFKVDPSTRVKLVCAEKPRLGLKLFFSRIDLVIKISGSKDIIKERLIYHCPSAAKLSLKGIPHDANVSIAATFYDHKKKARYRGDIGPIAANKAEGLQMVMKSVKDVNIDVDVVFEDGEGGEDEPKDPGEAEDPMSCEEAEKVVCPMHIELFAKCKASFFHEDTGRVVEKHGSNRCVAKVMVQKEICKLKKKHPEGKMTGEIECSLKK